MPAVPTPTLFLDVHAREVVMPAMMFRSPEDTPEVVVGNVLPQGRLRAKLSDEEMEHRHRMFHPGGPEALQLFEIAVDPGRGARAHAHAEDEIIYVLEGEAHFGNRVVKAGGSVYIPAHTLYSFRAGPKGLRFLNFRARANSAYFTKEELQDVRHEVQRAKGAS
jgi:quercetin dioxygenase-like cupin family protein